MFSFLSMGWIKDSLLLFAVRQTLKRIVKDISSEQLDRVGWSDDGLGVVFELSNLQLNEAFINETLLGAVGEGSGDSESFNNSVRYGLFTLVSGHVSGVQASFGLGAKGKRSLEVDGLQLVFDVNPSVVFTTRSSHSQSPRRQPREDSGSEGGVDGCEYQSDIGGEVADDVMYSSLFTGEYFSPSAEGSSDLDLQGESMAGGDLSGSCHAIDDGVKTIVCVIKQLAYSVSGCIRNVSVILRVPPCGSEILPGEEPPHGTIELVVSLEDGFELFDVCSDPINDIVHKNVRFSGLQAAIYLHGKHHTTLNDEVERGNVVGMDEIFLCGGPPNGFINNVVFHFGKVRDTRQGSIGACLNIRVTTKMFLFVLTPAKLLHLVNFARSVVGLTEGTAERATAEGEPEQSARNGVVPCSAALKVTCQYISCTLLPCEDREGVKQAWRSLLEYLDDTDPNGELLLSRRHRVALHRALHRTGFYEIYVGGITLLLQPVAASTTRSEDAFYDVFENHSGRSCSVGIIAVEVYERLSSCSADTGDNFFGDGGSWDGASDNKYGRIIFATRRNAESHSERRYRIAIFTRTTHPLSVSDANKYTNNLLGSNSAATAAVIEHVLVKTSGADVIVSLNASALCRLGSFWKKVQQAVDEVPPSVAATDETSYEGVLQQQQFISAASLHSFSSERDMPEGDVDISDLNMSGKLCCTPPLVAEPAERAAYVPDPEMKNSATCVVLRFFTLDVERVTVEMKFATSNPPESDYYGPLTRRLWDHLQEEGKAMHTSDTALPLGFGDVEGPYLPITLSFDLEKLMLSADSAGSGEIFLDEMRLILNDYMEDAQSEVLRCVFDKEAREPCIAVQCRSVLASCEDLHHRPMPQTPFTSAQRQEEAAIESKSMVNIKASVRHISGTLHKSEFLLASFLLGQVAEAIDKLCFMMGASDSIKENEYGTNPEIVGNVLPRTTSTCVRLVVGEGVLTLWAPRLSSAGISIGEPLWRCIPKVMRRTISTERLYHHYRLKCSDIDMFVFHQTSQAVVKTTCHAAGVHFHIEEKLCSVWPDNIDFQWPPEHASSPAWGAPTVLLQSYTASRNESSGPHAGAPCNETAKDVRSCHAVGISVCRYFNLEEHTEVFDAIVHLDCISISHHSACEGDYWIFVLLKYFSDPSAEEFNAAVAQKVSSTRWYDDGAGDVRSDEGVSVAWSAKVKVKLFDTLVEYRPFGRYSMVICIAPYVELDLSVPSIATETTFIKLLVGSEAISLYLHDNFPRSLLACDRESNARTLFVGRGKNVNAELGSIGFVRVVDISRPLCESKGYESGCTGADSGDGTGAAALIVHINPTAEKPVFIRVQDLHATAHFAQDSLYHFHTILRSFVMGLDVDFLPSPYLLVQRSGSYFGHITHVNSVKNRSSVGVHILVHDYEAHIDHLLSTSVIAIHEETLEPVEGEVTSCCSSCIALSCSDFDMIDTADYEEPQPVVWRTRDGGAADLLQHCKFENFLSVYSSVDGEPCLGSWGFNRSRGDEPRSSSRIPWSLPSFTSVSLEVFLHDCDVTTYLYSGEDFVHTDIPQNYLHTLQRFAIDEDLSPQVSWNSPRPRDTALNSEETHDLKSPAPCSGPRRSDDYVVAYLRGVRAQFDLFTPGKSHFMQLHLAVKDGEVIDRIRESSVETLLMASLPQSLRDYDSDLFAMKWTTNLPRTSTANARTVIVGKPEVELRIGLQPITVALHRRAMNLLPRFIEVPDNVSEENVILNGIQTDRLFFSKVIVDPFTVTLYVYFEGRSASAALQGNVFELCNYLLPSVERVHVRMPLMVITSRLAENVFERFCELLGSEIGKFRAVLLLCCGVQPLQLASNVASAGTRMLLAPLNEHRRNKRFFAALCCALRSFLSTLASESLHSVAGVSHSLHHATSSSISYLVPASGVRPMARGSQPLDAVDGLKKGLLEFAQGFRVAYGIGVYCLGPQGSTLCLPIALSAILDGLLRGTGEVLRGARNAISTEMYEQERKIFKGSQRV